MQYTIFTLIRNNNNKKYAERYEIDSLRISFKIKFHHQAI